MLVLGVVMLGGAVVRSKWSVVVSRSMGRRWKRSASVADIAAWNGGGVVSIGVGVSIKRSKRAAAKGW